MSNATTVQIAHGIKVGGLLTCRCGTRFMEPTVKVRVHANGTCTTETGDLGFGDKSPPQKKNMAETRRRLGRIAQKRRAGTKSRSMRYYRFRFCEYLGAAICSKCCKLQPFVFEVSVSYFFLIRFHVHYRKMSLIFEPRTACQGCKIHHLTGFPAETK